jgi:hypothetical protein
MFFTICSYIGPVSESSNCHHRHSSSDANACYQSASEADDERDDITTDGGSVECQLLWSSQVYMWTQSLPMSTYFRDMPVQSDAVPTPETVRQLLSCQIDASAPTFNRFWVQPRTRQNTYVYPFLIVRLELDILQAQMNKRTCSDDPRRMALLSPDQRNVRCVDIVLWDSPYEGEFSLTSHSRRPQQLHGRQ